MEKIFSVIAAARHAEEARLDLLEAAAEAGLKIDFTEGDQILAVERAALQAMKATKLSGENAELRDAIFAVAAVEGNHSDIVSPCADLETAAA